MSFNFMNHYTLLLIITLVLLISKTKTQIITTTIYSTTTITINSTGNKSQQPQQLQHPRLIPLLLILYYYYTTTTIPTDGITSVMIYIIVTETVILPTGDFTAVTPVNPIIDVTTKPIPTTFTPNASATLNTIPRDRKISKPLLIGLGTGFFKPGVPEKEVRNEIMGNSKDSKLGVLRSMHKFRLLLFQLWKYRCEKFLIWERILNIGAKTKNWGGKNLQMRVYDDVITIMIWIMDLGKRETHLTQLFFTRNIAICKNLEWC
ncbi:hypothetical protein Glove_168g143 [Diversispora epigaea]|uniref:Uncharacterized protein n=1 Tax=Diversispora epigaea TaxID=1348612 RepID=A0A397IT22_9GLOM|nr:hypothetical protein Glove_168g143 [Diversispora epigaea]